MKEFPLQPIVCSLYHCFSFPLDPVETDKENWVTQLSAADDKRDTFSFLSHGNNLEQLKIDHSEI